MIRPFGAISNQKRSWKYRACGNADSLGSDEAQSCQALGKQSTFTLFRSQFWHWSFLPQAVELVLWHRPSIPPIERAGNSYWV